MVEQAAEREQSAETGQSSGADSRSENDSSIAEETKNTVGEQERDEATGGGSPTEAAPPREEGSEDGGKSRSSRPARSSGSRKTSAARKKGTDRQEVEWRFDAPEGLEGVEGWLAGHDGPSGVVVREGRTKELSDTYYDTADWRVYRSGYALRVREGEDGGGAEATLKSLASDDGRAGEARRREISEPLKGEGVEDLAKSKGPVGERFWAFVGAREVRPVFSIRTRRRAFDLVLNPSDEAPIGEPEDGRDDGETVVDASGDIRGRAATDGDGTPVGEVALDSTEVLLGEGEEPARLSRVEVEVEEADSTSGLEAFVAQMQKELGLKPTRISKYDAGLFATGQSPEAATDLGPTRVDGSLSLGELAFAVLRRQFAVMRAHEAGARLGEDPEEVHDMRVATRRMRAAIKLYKDALPERSRWIRSELKWVAGSLGEVRDLDVQLEQLEEWSAGDEEGREALSRVTSALQRRREEARGQLVTDLDSARYERFETSFADMLKLGPTREAVPGGGTAGDSKADEPSLAAAPGLLSRRYRKWCRVADSVHGASDPEQFHELRKEGKRLRYALEFFSDVYGSTDALVKPLKVVQDDLGRHQDAIVAAGWLRELATGGHRFPARAAFAMGLRAQVLLQEAAGIRSGFRDTEAYRAVAGGKAWKALQKEMKKKSPSPEKNKAPKAKAKKGSKAEGAKKKSKK